VSDFISIIVFVEREFVPRTDGYVGLRETGNYIARNPAHGRGRGVKFSARQVPFHAGPLEGTHRLAFHRTTAERICRETGIALPT
jgi:hypothetical protein